MSSDFDRLHGDVRTEHQVTRFAGFAPGPIHSRNPVRECTDGERTMRLAKPPEWTQTPGLCVGRWDEYDETRGRLSEKRAAALCFGCPILEECLEAAMAEEVDVRVSTQGTPLGAQHRYGIRGGLTPKGRARKAGAREEPCGKGHTAWREKPNGQRYCVSCQRIRDERKTARRREERENAA